MVKKKDIEVFLSAANTFLSEGKKLSNDSKTVTITGQTEGVHVQVIGRNAHGNVAYVNGFFNGNHALNDKAMTFPFEEFKNIVSLIETEEFQFSLSEDGERKEYLNIGLSKTYKMLIDDDKYVRLFEEDIEEAQKSAVFCVDKRITRGSSTIQKTAWDASQGLTGYEYEPLHRVMWCFKQRMEPKPGRG